jgi:hypothetical protein
MLTLIFALIFGLAVTYFATQNGQAVTLSIGSYMWSQVPLYLVAIGFLLIGLVTAWLFSLLNSFSSFLTLNSREKIIKDKDRHLTELKKHLHDLESENERLKNQKNVTMPHPTPV